MNVQCFFFAAVLLLACTSTAYAYLDPGTGSYVLQMVIAGIVGGMFALKLCYRRIVKFFADLFRGKKSGE